MEEPGGEDPARSHRPNPQAWKPGLCFTSNEAALPLQANRTVAPMDSRKPLLELKDVPPPPHHSPSSSLPVPFPLPLLPAPPPCLLPPPSAPQTACQQQQQQHHPLSPPARLQDGPFPKVSICGHCGITGVLSNSSGGGAAAGVPVLVSVCGAPCSIGEPVWSSSSSSSVHVKHIQSCSGAAPAFLPASQPSRPCFPCCSRLLHSCSAAAPPPPSAMCRRPAPALLASSPSPSSFPSLPAPLHGSCLVSSGFYTCGVGCESSASGRSHPITTAVSTTTCTTSTSSSSSSAHFCSGPAHLNVERTVCVRGAAHCCRDCLMKPANGLTAGSDALWPKVPVPQSAPVSVPVCNGCGASSDCGAVLPNTSHTKPGHIFEGGAGPENIPPIGVFWDIENCSVPSGRSAGAVVQRIRSRFFKGHREAEFICVCDISKESKAVIQELNNCQVTVAHINATAKNAADDKLRQSLRRFAETHTAPATVVLVSSDVNFASELSDLRHRHGFRVALVHGCHTSSALLQHAHQHVAFRDITADLPLRVPDKTEPTLNLLYVHNLPVACDKSLRNAVKLRLRRLSDNCGGKVLGVSEGTAVLRFGSHEAAARARRRMENEDVFGYRIRPSFSPRNEEEEDRDAGGEGDGPPLYVPPARARSDPPPASFFAPVPPSPPFFFNFFPPETPRSPRRPRRAARPCPTPGTVPERPYSPRRGSSGPPGGAPVKPRQDPGNAEPKQRSGQQPDRSHAAAICNGETRAAEQQSKLCFAGDPTSRRRNGASSPDGDFHISTPSAFSKLKLHGSFSPLLVSQSGWSPRSASPCHSSRSSPLLAPPRSPLLDGPEPFSDGAEVLVANLDYRMSRKDLQQNLRDAFSRFGQVKSVELSPHTDYQLKASVLMSSLQQAIGAVSGLHRHKVGGKRIQVSLVTGGNNKSLALLSSEIVSILQDSPASCLPLFKFTEIYEKKFSRKVALSDLYKLPELVAVRDQGGSRLVCLLPSGQTRQSPLGSCQSQDGGSSLGGSPVVFEELEYHEPVCRRHHSQPDFSEADFDPDSYKIPFAVLSLDTLASEVHSLLQEHDGTLPLLSFPDCYAALFRPLALGGEATEGAVPLEHLITCVPSVVIVTAQNGFKVLKWLHNKPPTQVSEPWIQRCRSPVGNPQLIQFSREVVDLLKSQPSCVMPVSKFIPSYHHHFAKQCRVSDYGFSKLLELLEAVPHVLQILGMGTRCLLTLTHRAQVKRFTQDLLKLLKFQASKQVSIRDFMQAYHWCFSRDWKVTDYGACHLMDLLKEIPDSTISICEQSSETVISVPKRDRTAEEVERTKQFGKEVVDLLRHQPHCRMPFSKFIPTYHHHFGRQCKLSYYGFAKLVELFEAIPDTLTVLECGEEKVLTLTEVERLKALAAQLVKLLRAQRNYSLPVGQLLPEYSKTFGYGLRLQDYEAASVSALLSKLSHVVKVVDGAEGSRELQLINRKSLRTLTYQLLALLMSQGEEEVPRGMRVAELSRLYEAVHGAALNPCEYGFLSLSELLKSLPSLIQLYHEGGNEDVQAGQDAGTAGDERVRLTVLYRFARDVRALLHTYHYNQIFLTEFLSAYAKFTGRSLDPRAYECGSVDDLLNAIPQVVWIKGHGHKRIIVLKNDMKVRAGSSSPSSPRPGDVSDSPRDSPVSCTTSGAQSPAVDPELLCLAAPPVDLLCGPVPSCLPSPQLHPDPIGPRPADLIHFEGNSAVAPPGDAAENPNASACGAAGDPSLPDSGSGSPRSAESPSRRTSRSRIRLAANFTFTADL